MIKMKWKFQLVILYVMKLINNKINNNNLFGKNLMNKANISQIL